MSESDLNIATPLEHITFGGQPVEDVTTFLQSVKRVAIAQGRQRDDDWQVDYVEACLAGDALRWFSELDDGTLGSWRSVRDAFLRRFATPVNRPASPLAAAPALPMTKSAQQSNYPLPPDIIRNMAEGAMIAGALLVGNSGVGKSCLLSRWCGYGWPHQITPTQGIAYEIRTENRGGSVRDFHWWDASGTVQPQTLLSQFPPSAVYLCFVYDVTNQASFDNIRSLHQIFCAKPSADVEGDLVGNKIDLSGRVVTTEQGRALATELGLEFYEASAKTNQGIQSLRGPWLPHFVAQKNHGRMSPSQTDAIPCSESRN